MTPTLITAIAGLITAITALVRAFNHQHGPQKIPPGKDGTTDAS